MFEVKMQMRAVAVVLVLLSMLLGGCQVYSNLYGAPGQNQSAVYVPDSSIVVEQQKNESPAREEGLSDEAKKLAEELQKKIDAKAAQEAGQEKPAAQQPAGNASAEPQQAGSPAQSPQAQAIIVQETDKVALKPKATDPDGDALVFAFTSPLDENGEWQTAYGDAGQYTVTVTASDGQLTTTKEVLVIVNKKEEPPVIGSSSPKDSSVSLKETDAQAFSIEASDLNKDPLTYEWKLDGGKVSDTTSYNYQTTYDDSGSHTVKVDVTDGASAASRIWAVNVDNVNRKPKLSPISAVSAKETDTITIKAEAEDDDGDAIAYSISDPRFTQDKGTFVWKTDYDSAGSYTVKVSASDGQDSVSQDVQITVANVNRRPEIIDISQG
ncbi:TPA: hypothetical protein HA281_05780 [Candidatus Woesearchaeota archaeon]|nr:hypothetical protein [Candidatus Woesearchaeota archaeon]HIH92283.1 hypothetical protein [Candidatus Woesearchaeota archaeon]HII64857.1 hypothetical protein [Candidatus Woesearchaeota archaeon]HII65426.1 hypothetical protein [Candidatus Woesearchaeota archaeon]HIJ18502.1 hypothetical protein [Candidatus Woesearchaeota archaeon]